MIRNDHKNELLHNNQTDIAPSKRCSYDFWLSFHFEMTVGINHPISTSEIFIIYKHQIHEYTRIVLVLSLISWNKQNEVVCGSYRSFLSQKMVHCSNEFFMDKKSSQSDAIWKIESQLPLSDKLSMTLKVESSRNEFKQAPMFLASFENVCLRQVKIKQWTYIMVSDETFI